MMVTMALAIYSALLITLAYQAGNARGYERGLDEAACLIFGIPMVWP